LSVSDETGELYLYEEGKQKLSKKSYTNRLAPTMDEELTSEELMDLRVILVHFMADKEAHKKIPRLASIIVWVDIHLLTHRLLFCSCGSEKRQ
jgi:hypothetical protein